MIVLLKKVRVNTIFSAFEPIIVEPLELCYLKTVLNSMNIESYIVDELLNLNEPTNKSPDAVVLTGYNVAEQEIIKEAKRYKLKYPNCKIIVGGVHVQRNAHEFKIKEIDYIFNTQSLSVFEKLISNLANNIDSSIEGINFNNNIVLSETENITPNRSLFYEVSNKLHYLEKRNVALIKGSIGCPYNCSYCYCKLVNNGQYIKTNYEKVIFEMECINADYFWIVDDVLFATRNDALDFIKIIKHKNLKLKIIGYLRADFILKEKDLLPALREAGLTEVIIGFEATDNNELKNYSKTTNALDYPEVISLLKLNNIELTALFMVKPDYKVNNFYKLYKFIKNNKIEVYTISILTPIKGTKDYELQKDYLTTTNPKKFDFLHLVFKSKLPKWLFYSLFYMVHIRLLKSKRIWQYILKK